MRSKAYCLIRQQPHYRHESFVAGLKAAGYDVSCQPPDFPARRDQVLVIWNRYGVMEQLADRFEADGGAVLVAENGYLGAAGGTPKREVHKGIQPTSYYALARHGHNGSGQWPQGGPERFEQLGVELAPWRQDGGHILVCPNRYFGMKGFVMPADWDVHTAKRLRAATGRQVRIRPHPGNGKPLVPLEKDLEGCWAVAIWASSAGVHALARGIPVMSDAPWWICKGAAATLAQIQTSALPERRPAFERLAWAQWTVEEIAAGVPFRRLLQEEAVSA